jgi:hypothetical protein
MRKLFAIIGTLISGGLVTGINMIPHAAEAALTMN